MEPNRPQQPPQQSQPPNNKIQQSKPGIVLPGQRQEGAATAPMATDSPRPVIRLPDENRPLPVAQPTGPMGSGSKITSFGKEKRHEETWSRTPNTTGTGAIHVKTFHCKLTEDAIAYMDQMVNDWLDAHPQYEVKFVTSTIGTMTGKLKEPALFCQVWV